MTTPDRPAARVPEARVVRPAPWRRPLALGLVWLPVVLLAVLGSVWLPRLPDVTASHWSGSGAADGFTASVPFWAWTTAVAAAIAAVATIVAYARRVLPFVAVWCVVGGAFVTALAALLWTASAAATLRAPGPEQALLGAGGVAALFVPFAWAGLAFLAHGRPAVVRPEPASIEPLPLADTERAAWSTTLTSRMFLYLAAGVGVLGGLMTFSAANGNPETRGIFVPLAVLFVGVAFMLLVLARVRVSVDGRGLRLTSWLGFPVTRIPLDDVAAARAEQLEPGEWGGWGYRWMPGRTAFVLRRGPALVVDRRDGRQFAVTLDDPATPAALLERLRADVA
ncbi:conserved hypothetical protein [Beutenbergia cavernae DSM 12333]|uniref:DUF1648 domain-containing protein n=1 Tax=Beutenbergia cavernae (strain ATCC BAA-8 / DSM 12333 / CCUG 43141 / JCM 11478 / NBRC 16432 / NCIMB 13614 / HKI 0122) TaxID=471853 RepID=C5BUZ9_BEUC1|nr:hypothetical protein [Beutenbergia cavernae]ACQ78373.1 conserved hypothetical protein [Beutenbergia cavernae DSM 12333]